MSFPAYESYRDSGVEWLGEIPKEWKVVRVKDLATIINGYPFDSKNFDSGSGQPLVRIRDLNAAETDVKYNGESEPGYEITSKDLLIGMDGDFNVGRWKGKVPALLNQRVCALRAVPTVSRLLEHALPDPLKRINDLTYSTTVKHLSSYEVGSTMLALPPTDDELAALVAFLDRETAKIDALVEAQQRLIELLKEKRQAVISHAVTKGLDPKAPMKDSGVEWLGEVPAHWEVRKLTGVSRLETGHTPSRQHPEYWIPGDCVIPWFTLADVGTLRNGQRTHVSDTENLISEIGMENSAARLLPASTVILSRTASVGFSAIMDVPMAVSQDFAAWICSDLILPEYLLYCLRAMQPEFRRLMMGSTHQTIYMPDIEAFRVPVPPISEQNRIVQSTARQIIQSDALSQQAERAVTILQERRAALISATVTGKIDVRAVASAENAAEAA